MQLVSSGRGQWTILGKLISLRESRLGQRRCSGVSGLGKSCRYVVESSKSATFLMVLDLGTSLELNFMQFRIEPTNRRSISRDFEFFEKFIKQINFWFVLGVTGKARSQEMSIFEIFEHLKTLKILESCRKVKEKL